MNIEFSCSQCGQTLRVAQDAAGKRAKCPKCSHVNQIPESSSPFEDGGGELRLQPEMPRTPPDATPFGHPQANPYTSPAAGLGTSGGTGKFSGSGKIANVPTEIGNILNYSFALWQQHLGLLVGATVVLWLIGGGIGGGLGAVVAVVEQMGSKELALVLQFFGQIFAQLVQLYLGIGMTQMLLKMARNRPAEFSDIFNGGPQFLPALGISILFGLAVMGGFLLLIIPGIIVLLIWWPCYFLVIDGKSSVMDSFGLARTITEGNVGTTFLIWLVSVGIVLLGVLACCVGLLFAVPLTMLMPVVAYLMMSGQIPLQPDTSFQKKMV